MPPKKKGGSKAASRKKPKAEKFALPKQIGVWVWAQCDNAGCQKWRKLPPGTVVDDNEPWFCYMNPNEDMNDCNIPEEEYNMSTEAAIYSIPPSQAHSEGSEPDDASWDSRNQNRSKRSKRSARTGRDLDDRIYDGQDEGFERQPSRRSSRRNEGWNIEEAQNLTGQDRDNDGAQWRDLPQNLETVQGAHEAFQKLLINGGTLEGQRNPEGLRAMPERVWEGLAVHAPECAESACQAVNLATAAKYFQDEKDGKPSADVEEAVDTACLALTIAAAVGFSSTGAQMSLAEPTSQAAPQQALPNSIPPLPSWPNLSGQLPGLGQLPPSLGPQSASMGLPYPGLGPSPSSLGPPLAGLGSLSPLTAGLDLLPHSTAPELPGHTLQTSLAAGSIAGTAPPAGSSSASTLPVQPGMYGQPALAPGVMATVQNVQSQAQQALPHSQTSANHYLGLAPSSSSLPQASASQINASPGSFNVSSNGGIDQLQNNGNLTSGYPTASSSQSIPSSSNFAASCPPNNQLPWLPMNGQANSFGSLSGNFGLQPGNFLLPPGGFGLPPELLNDYTRFLQQSILQPAPNAAKQSSLGTSQASSVGNGLASLVAPLSNSQLNHFGGPATSQNGGVRPLQSQQPMGIGSTFPQQLPNNNQPPHPAPNGVFRPLPKDVWRPNGTKASSQEPKSGLNSAQLPVQPVSQTTAGFPGFSDVWTPSSSDLGKQGKSVEQKTNINASSVAQRADQNFLHPAVKRLSNPSSNTGPPPKEL